MIRIASVIVCLALAAPAGADVFNMGGARGADGSWTGLASLETVTVGNPGNAADTHSTPGHGAVAYVYNIGKYEVTAGQYCEFLNHVAAADTYGLYNTRMGGVTMTQPGDYPVSAPYGCGIQRSGSPGSYTYSVAADWANRPVNHVSWGDAARFVNWLQNGQPAGAQDLTTTEDGSYWLNGATSQAALMAVAPRKAGARWVLPTEDEWYKAAYHKNDGVTGHYWDYPARSNSQPINTLVTPDPGNHANYYDYYHTGNWGYTIGAPYWATEVGAFENSASPYGVFDQAGNVWEWNETAIDGLRGNLGGGWNEDGWFPIASNRFANEATSDYDFRFGFRVAHIPAPATGLGDFSGDGVVDQADYTTWADNYGRPRSAKFAPGSYPADGPVTQADYTTWADNYGQTCPAVAP